MTAVFRSDEMPGRDQAAPISVLVVTYNSGHVVGRCLTPLHEDPALQIVVYDNASTDNTLEVLSHLPRVQVITGAKNLGFAKAVNEAGRRATGEVVCLLNPDVQISSEALRRLSELALREDVGVVAPCIHHPTGRLRVRECGRFPSVLAVFNHYSGLSAFGRYCRRLEGMYWIGDLPAAAKAVDWVSGAVMMTSLAHWKQLGGLSERWFMYAEDIELCYRSKCLGRQTLVVGDVEAVHDLGGSTSDGPSSNAAWVVNLFDFYKTSMARTRLQSGAWKHIVVGGLRSRALVYALRSRSRTPGQSALWRAEADRFRTFATAVAKTPTSLTVEEPAGSR